MVKAAGQSYKRLFAQGFAILSVTYLLVLTAGFTLSFLNRDLRYAGGWALKVAGVMAYQLIYLLRNRNRILAGANLDHLWGLANILTLIRGGLIAVLAGFLFVPKPPGVLGWLPALLYTLLASLDFLDGYWARKSNTTTRLGELLDQEYDALGILVAIVLTIQYGQLPAAFIYIGLAKYVFSWGMAWRKHRGATVYSLPPSYMRRRLAGFQMGILAVFLWPIARPPGTLLAELIVGVPLLFGFIRDWLLVSGALDPEDPAYLKTKELFYRVGKKWLPLIVRSALVAAAVTIAAASIHQGSFSASWMPLSFPGPELLGVVYTAMRVLLLLVLVAGRLTSASALLLLLLEGIRIFHSHLDPWGAVIVTAALLLYLFGSGPYRLFLRSRPRLNSTSPSR